VDRRFLIGPVNEIAFLGEVERNLELKYNKNNNSVKFGKDISLGFQVECIHKIIKFLKEKGIEI
jgi:lactoylglutathione lyase